MGIVQLNAELQIDFTPPWYLETPCTFLFSVRPGNPLSAYSDTIITFFNTDNRVPTYIIISWALDEFKYTISNDIGANSNNGISINVNTAQLNHIGFQCLTSKINMWLNGKLIEQHNVNFNRLLNIRVGGRDLGIISLYDRDLTKMEMVQHFIDHHVENFTNDEVLI